MHVLNVIRFGKIVSTGRVLCWPIETWLNVKILSKSQGGFIYCSRLFPKRLTMVVGSRMLDERSGRRSRGPSPNNHNTDDSSDSDDSDSGL